VVQSTDLEITSGRPREVAKTADSGNRIKNYFCADCGTPLFGWKITSDGERDEVTIVRAGIFDDVGILNGWRPEAEIYTGRRLEWVCPIEGAAQVGGMYSQL